MLSAAAPVFGTHAGPAAEAADSAASAATAAAHSPYEVALMLGVLLLILLAGGMILRLLLRLRVIRGMAWLAPILTVLTGAAWVAVSTSGRADLPSLQRLMLFLFLVLVMLSALIPLSTVLFPAHARRTRGAVPPLLRGLALAVVLFVTTLMLLIWAFPGISLAPLFVTSGIVSIVLGLAIQDLLGNLLSGIVISAESHFKVGEWIRVGDVEGEVAEITWQIVKLRTRENDYVVLPNHLVAKERIVNYEHPTPLHLVKVHVSVAYDTPCGQVVGALLDAAKRVDGVLAKPPAHCHLKDFLDSGILYELRTWIDNYASLLAIESDLRMEIWYAFKRHGIVIPFPQRDVHVHPVAEVPSRLNARLTAVGGPLRGAVFPLGDQRLLIGRTPECAVSVADPHVSNQHAAIERDGDRFVVIDLGSRLGTLVNGKPVTRATLRQGDSIAVGPVLLTYESSHVPEA